jgi:prepilin-type N-terminal cleavage/methylation domain-containing protein
MKRGGFTLLEILVSIAILALIVVLLAQVANTASRAWISTEARKEVLQNVRAIGEFIGAEMRVALLPANRTSQSSLQFIVNPTASNGSYSNRDAVFWQVSLASNQTLGDVAEIGYFVQWNTDDPQNPKARLCRFFVNPTTGDYTPNPDFLIYSNPTGWLTADLIRRTAPADKANAYNGLFAENVVGFWVQCLDAAGQPITKTYSGTAYTAHAYDSRLGYTASDGSKNPGYTDSSGNAVLTCALPPMVELSFVMLDARTARKIGPSQQTAIQKIVAQSADASAFLTAAQADTHLANLFEGFRTHHTKVYLQNSK